MDEVGKQVGIGLQLRLLVREFRQQAHRSGKRVPGRVVSGKDNQQPGSVQEFRAERLAVDLDVGDG